MPRDPRNEDHKTKTTQRVVFLCSKYKVQSANKEKTVIPVLDTGTQVIYALCVSTDNLLSLRGSIATVAIQ